MARRFCGRLGVPFALSENFPSICWSHEEDQVSRQVTLHLCLQRNWFCRMFLTKLMGPEAIRTAPEVALSWLLLPVTLKATLLGVLLLTSMVPAERW